MFEQKKKYTIYIYTGRELWRLCKTGFHCVMGSQSEKNYLMHSKNLLKFHGPIKVFYSLILAVSSKLHCSCKIRGIHSQLSFKHPLILVSQFSFPECKSSWSQFFKPKKDFEYPTVWRWWIAPQCSPGTVRPACEPFGSLLFWDSYRIGHHLSQTMKKVTNKKSSCQAPGVQRNYPSHRTNDFVLILNALCELCSNNHVPFGTLQIYLYITYTYRYFSGLQHRYFSHSFHPFLPYLYKPGKAYNLLSLLWWESI